MAMTCLAQVSGALAPKFDSVHLFAGHEGASVPAPCHAQPKELEDLQARLITSEARTRQREGKLEDVRARGGSGRA